MLHARSGVLAFIAISMATLRPVSCILPDKAIGGEWGLLRGEDVFQELIQKHFRVDNPYKNQNCAVNDVETMHIDRQIIPALETVRQRRDVPGKNIAMGSNFDGNKGFSNDALTIRSRRQPTGPQKKLKPKRRLSLKKRRQLKKCKTDISD